MQRGFIKGNADGDGDFGSARKKKRESDQLLHSKIENAVRSRDVCCEFVKIQSRDKTLQDTRVSANKSLDLQVVL